MGNKLWENLAQVSFIIILMSVVAVPCMMSSYEVDEGLIVEASSGGLSVGVSSSKLDVGVGSTVTFDIDDSNEINFDVSIHNTVEVNKSILVDDSAPVGAPNNIMRISTGAQVYEGFEINRPAVYNGEVYYLYQRPTSRPANSFLRYNNISVFTFIDSYGEQPQTYWMHYNNGDEVLWVGQLLQLDSEGVIISLPASTVLLKDGIFQSSVIPGTVNCNEFIGVAYYKNRWYAGERSGDCLNYAEATYPRGGGLWESADGLEWFRHTDIEDPIEGEFGRELLLATLDGDLYGFYQGESDSKTLIRRLNTDENVAESKRLDQGLVPFQIHPDGFDWKGYIPLRTGDGLGWFNGETLSIQHFGVIDGRKVWDPIPLGVYEDKLFLSIRSGDQYSVIYLSEPFGVPVMAADNWMLGNDARGVVDGGFIYIGVLGGVYSALDRLNITAP